MSAGRALLGFVGAGIVVGGFGLGAVVARRRWCPATYAPLRQLIDAVLALAGILGASMVLGSVGLFDAVPLVIVALAVGAVSFSQLRRNPTNPTTPSTGTPAARTGTYPRWTVVAMVGAVSLVSIRWLAELLQTIGRGFSHADELHYHLTHAALFAQSGETWPVRFTSIGDGAAYHPAHSELLHGVGLVVLGSDFLSIFVNLIFVAMALAAAWCIGARAGNAPAGLLLVAAVLSLPLVTSESGSTLNDTMAIALLLTAVAFLLEATGAHRDRRFVVLAGVSAGLAAGTKLTVLVPVVALVLLLAVRPDPERVRSVVTYVLAAGLAGGYWYVRNLAATGNPVPALSFGPLPGPELEFQRAVEFSVLEYLTDVSIWQDYFLPGLATFFGPLWPLLPGAVVVAAVAALAPSMWRDQLRWPLLSICGLVSIVSYLITPTSAAGAEGAPTLFPFNLRYALPGLLLCGLAGLAHPLFRRHPSRVAAAVVVVFLASNLHRADIARFTVATIAVGAVVVVGWFLVGRPEARRPVFRNPTGRTVVAASTVVVGIAAGVVLNEAYLENRWTKDLARWTAFEAGDSVRDTAIGVTGFPQNYPFFGTDLSNDVITLGDDSPGDELVPFDRCEEWWSAATDAEVEVVVVLSEDALADTDLGRQVIGAPTRWLEDAGAPLVVAGRDAEVYDVRSATLSC